MRTQNSTYAQLAIRLCLWFYFRMRLDRPPDGSHKPYQFFSPADHGILPSYSQTGFSDYLTARHACDLFSDVAGLGICLRDIYAVIIDKCIGPDGNPEEWIRQIVERAYCEYTPDRLGIICLVSGDIVMFPQSELPSTVSVMEPGELLPLSGEPLSNTTPDIVEFPAVLKAIAALWQRSGEDTPNESTTPISESQTGGPAAVPPPEPNCQSHDSTQFASVDEDRGTNLAEEAVPWPPLKSDEAVSYPVLPFNTQWLPRPFVAYVLWIARALQMPVDFPAVLIMAALGGLALRRFCVKPKHYDNWTIYPNLWALIIAPPGFTKSACMQLAMFALLTREITTDGDRPKRRYYTSDTTVEKLQDILAENPAGLTVWRDEIFGFFMSLSRKGHESARQFYIESWDGQHPFAVDRVARGSKFIPHLCLSIIGGMQPDKVNEFVREALASDDGFAARFQLLIQPDLPTDFKSIDEAPDPIAQANVTAAFDRVLDWSPDCPHELRFDDDAQKIFEPWYEGVMKRTRSGKLAPAMRSHLAKYPKLMPAIAGLIHVAEDPDNDLIPEDRALRAIQWCDYLECHAVRVYSRVIGGHFGPTATLARRIKNRSLPSRFTVRDVYSRGWSGLGDSEVVRKVLKELEEAGWVRPCRPSGVGRPSDAWEVNPVLLEG